MQEASALKTREYLACGIPLILAHDDTDLMDAEFDFILKIKNSEENVKNNIDKIRNFIYQARGLRADRNAVAMRIDSGRKEQQRLRFMETEANLF